MQRYAHHCTNYYIFKGEDLLEFINNNSRKSIPFNIIEEKGIKLSYNYNIGLDYIKGIDIAYKGVGLNGKIKN